MKLFLLLSLLSLFAVGCSTPSFQENFAKGLALLDGGRSQAAVEPLEEALSQARDPQRAQAAWLLLVESRLAAGETALAEEMVQEKLDENPLCFAGWRARASLELQKGNLKATRKALKAASALTRRPSDLAWLDGVRTLVSTIEAFEQGDLDQALQSLEPPPSHPDLIPLASYLKERILTLKRLLGEMGLQASSRGRRDGERDALNLFQKIQGPAKGPSPKKPDISSWKAPHAPPRSLEGMGGLLPFARSRAHALVALFGLPLSFRS